MCAINYEETFAHVSKMKSIRILLALAATRQWPLYQMDVKIVFLNGDLSETIYMQPSPSVTTSPKNVHRL